MWLLTFFIGIVANVFSDIHIYFFDVGQGNCILLRNEVNAILVDAGSKNTPFSSIEKSFARCLGGTKIKGIILTHSDVDHTNFVQEIYDNYRDEFIEDTVIYSIRAENHCIVSGSEPKFLRKVRGLEYDRAIDKMQNTLNELFSPKTFTFLKAAWSSSSKIDDNTASLVFSFKYKNCKVLFTGDSTGEALDNYIGQESNPTNWKYNRQTIENTNIFVMPHHGSEEGGSWRWTLNVTKNSPNLLATIVSINPKNSIYAHPRAWIKDVTWPDTMRSIDATNVFSYNRGSGQALQSQIEENLFTTGDHEEKVNFIEFTIKERDSSVSIVRGGREKLLGTPLKNSARVRPSTVLHTKNKRARTCTSSKSTPDIPEEE